MVVGNVGGNNLTPEGAASISRLSNLTELNISMLNYNFREQLCWARRRSLHDQTQ